MVGCPSPRKTARQKYPLGRALATASPVIVTFAARGGSPRTFTARATNLSLYLAVQAFAVIGADDERAVP